MNHDYEKRAFIDTNTIQWQKVETKDILKKILAIKDKEETSFIKLNEGSFLNQTEKINSVEIFVVEGIYINEYGEHPKGTYLRLPKENEALAKSNDGCVIFRKTNFFTDTQELIINTNTEEWLQGQGNLEVMPLYEQTALVKWPKDEKFTPHKHWGGEEIVVLEGTFIDEHGEYPKNSWLRSPHLSEHFPYVNEETIIFVKTGHI
ncbi:cupin domain-containing protein [Poseidonibacter lekithochrous]|uniref:cupin domain-containing protein n=1 Tax=Poseidonibacter TaxID=2321187 RepID=UPI001C095E69|nr:MULTISPECIES: cupin domain-containing protein [Poseidonibacter]MBU3015935.1 cupin domain-containing protein [Poseidonibacter lekithochrous]MDO6829234.1 cupin domain-containing protein [Poseidonibacter sp. 1_MG-2023]